MIQSFGHALARNFQRESYFSIPFRGPLLNAALHVSLMVNVFRQQPKGSARQCDKILRQKREILVTLSTIILMQDRLCSLCTKTKIKWA